MGMKKFFVALFLIFLAESALATNAVIHFDTSYVAPQWKIIARKSGNGQCISKAPEKYILRNAPNQQFDIDYQITGGLCEFKDSVVTYQLFLQNEEGKEKHIADLDWVKYVKSQPLIRLRNIKSDPTTDVTIVNNVAKIKAMKHEQGQGTKQQHCPKFGPCYGI